MINELYEQVVQILGTPESCRVSRVKTALQHLKTLDELPAKLQERGSVVVFYVGVASAYLREAQALNVGLVKLESDEIVPYSIVIGKVIKEILQPVIDSFTLLSTDEETICQV